MTTPADNLRDRIIAALDNARHTHPCPATGSQYWTGCYHSDGTGPSCHSERRADAVLAVLREPVARQVLGTPTTDTAPVSVPAAPADRATDRRDRYAAAMALRDGHPDWPVRYEDDERDYLRRADAVMAVADAEHVELRAAVLREAADAIERMQHDRDDVVADALGGLDRITEAQHVAVHRAAALLRRLADEATAAHHTVDGTRFLCHDGDHYCPTGPSRLADEAQPTETEALCGHELPPGSGTRPCICPVGHEGWHQDRHTNRWPATAATEEPQP